MQKWEYNEVYEYEDTSIAGAIGKLGLLGWELVSAFRDEEGFITYYLKRPIKED